MATDKKVDSRERAKFFLWVEGTSDLRSSGFDVWRKLTSSEIVPSFSCDVSNLGLWLRAEILLYPASLDCDLSKSRSCSIFIMFMWLLFRFRSARKLGTRDRRNLLPILRPSQSFRAGKGHLVRILSGIITRGLCSSRLLSRSLTGANRRSNSCLSAGFSEAAFDW